jgi:uncharacterized membrane protein YkoI
MHEGDLMSPNKSWTDADTNTIPCEEALAIARKDAETAYRDLSGSRIIIERKADGWHIDYELSDVYIHGGRPHYIIDATTGAIVSKRYEQ